MEIFWFILAIPVGIALFAKLHLGHTFDPIEMCAQLGITLLVTTAIWFIGIHVNTSDTEILNGQIISKHIVKDQYVRTYQCRCRQQCSGSGDYRTCTTVCDTCYEDRYTKTWYAKSTVGKITFEHLDRSSKRVWKEPDPKAYTICREGEPASRERSFTNYVKVTSDSLFNNSDIADVELAYPRVYNFYRINRVLNPDGIKVDTKTLNTLLNERLKTLGYEKQVNIIVVLTNKTQKYRTQVENLWLGGKKNDVVVFIGLNNDKRIAWSDVMTFGLNKGNERLQVQLRDGVNSIGFYDPIKIEKTVSQKIKMLYTRPHMSDYEYLKDDMKPSNWLVGILILLNIIGGGLLTLWFNGNDTFNTSYRRRWR